MIRTCDLYHPKVALYHLSHTQNKCCLISTTVILYHYILILSIAFYKKIRVFHKK